MAFRNLAGHAALLLIALSTVRLWTRRRRPSAKFDASEHVASVIGRSAKSPQDLQPTWQRKHSALFEGLYSCWEDRAVERLIPLAAIFRSSDEMVALPTGNAIHAEIKKT
jgi:hypothetical protein